MYETYQTTTACCVLESTTVRVWPGDNVYHFTDRTIRGVKRRTYIIVYKQFGLDTVTECGFEVKPFTL